MVRNVSSAHEEEGNGDVFCAPLSVRSSVRPSNEIEGSPAPHHWSIRAAPSAAAAARWADRAALCNTWTRIT